MVRVIAASALNDFHGLQGGKYRLAKSFDHGQIADRDRLRIAAAFGLAKSVPVRQLSDDECGVDPAVAASDPAAAPRASTVNRDELGKGMFKYQTELFFLSEGR